VTATGMKELEKVLGCDKALWLLDLVNGRNSEEVVPFHAAKSLVGGGFESDVRLFQLKTFGSQSIEDSLYNRQYTTRTELATCVEGLLQHLLARNEEDHIQHGRIAKTFRVAVCGNGSTLVGTVF
jgi:hypothetical protein